MTNWWMWPSRNRAADAVATWTRITCSNTAPRPAIPVAMPTWRNVLLIPDAIPLSSASTTPTAAEASEGFTNPTPTPATRNPGSSAVQCELALRPRMSSSPAPTRAAPPAISGRMGTRAVRRPPMGETTKETNVIGRNRIPACSGVKPRIP